MKLALEIALALTIANLVVLVAALSIGVDRELQLVDSDLRRDHRLLGTELASAVTTVWKSAGPEKALALLDKEPSSENLTLHWHWLDEETGTVPRLSLAQAAISAS